MLSLNRSFFVLAYQNTFPHKMNDTFPHSCYKAYVRFIHHLNSVSDRTTGFFHPFEMGDWLGYLYLNNHETFKEELEYLRSLMIVDGALVPLDMSAYHHYLFKKYGIGNPGAQITSLYDMMYYEAFQERYYYRDLFFYPMIELKEYRKIHSMLNKYRSYEPLLKLRREHNKLTLIHFLHYQSHHFYHLKEQL